MVGDYALNYLIKRRGGGAHSDLINNLEIKAFYHYNWYNNDNNYDLKILEFIIAIR